MSNQSHHIIVTGANGQLGSDLRVLEPVFQDFTFHFFSKENLDITNQTALEACVTQLKPFALINCAAYTNVEKAEEDKENADKINGLAAELLASVCKSNGVKLIHISTDYVFDGQAKKPYVETDSVAPLSVYGSSKLLGEQNIERVGGEYAIIRTSWLYSSFGNNFFKTMIRLAKERGELKVVNDQIGAPTYARHLAYDILTWLEKCLNNESKFVTGIYHYSQNGQASWYDFAKEIMLNKNMPIPVYPVSSAQFPTKARRPVFSKLNSTKFEKTTGIDILSWKEGVIACIHNEMIDHEHE
jgi:dTDP-4-dehydrorhamnose reductase